MADIAFAVAPFEAMGDGDVVDDCDSDIDLAGVPCTCLAVGTLGEGVRQVWPNIIWLCWSFNTTLYLFHDASVTFGDLEESVEDARVKGPTIRVLQLCDCGVRRVKAASTDAYEGLQSSLVRSTLNTRQSHTGAHRLRIIVRNYGS